MRTLLSLGLLALAARAEGPRVRWVDDKTGVRTEAVAAVLEETRSRLKVRLASGKVLDIGLQPLLDLVREDESVPAQRELLAARLAVQSGREPERTRIILDRIIARPAEKWMRGYAAAARALLAERTGEKDALERANRFLREHVDSRFASDVQRARARLLATDADPQMPFEKAWEQIEVYGGPRLVQFLTFLDAARQARKMKIGNLKLHDKLIVGGMQARLEAAPDVAALLAAESVRFWIQVAHLRDIRIAQAKEGDRPMGPLGMLIRLRRTSGHCLPELRSDLIRELAVCQEACGKPEQARQALSDALTALGNAPDRVRRDAIKADLKRLAK